MRRILKAARPCRLAIVLAPMLASTTWGAPASLSDWAGANNTTSLNNYAVITPTSAGGDFQDKVLFTEGSPAQPHQYYLSDPSLSAAADFTVPLSISGTITFDSAGPSAAETDTDWFFGWYSSADTRHRLGFGAADTSATSAGDDAMRWQMHYASGGGASFPNITSNGSNTSSLATLADGTYAFTMTYTPTGTNNLGATIGANFRNVTVDLSGDTTPFDRFGFLQKSNANAATTWNVVVSNLNYTGNTQVPEPAGLALAVFIPLGLMVRRLR